LLLESSGDPVVVQCSSIAMMFTGSPLGSIRKLLPDSSVLPLAPTLSQGAPVIRESQRLALLVIGLWVLVAAGLGAYRTATMDA
jgi:hypothetical protein